MKKYLVKQIPRILIIDDQFGRCGLGRRFRQNVSPEIYAGYEADRKNLCVRFGLLDVTGDARKINIQDPLAEAIFCPGQIWNEESNRIENKYEVAKRIVAKGWPFQDGRRWSMVLLDLRFTFGALNLFGDPIEGSMFGSDVLLPALRKDFGTDLPIVILSSTPKDQYNAELRSAGALDFIQRIPGAGAPPDECRASLEKVLFTHGLIEDSTGTVVGNSLAILKVLRQARRGAMSARNILLLGETGTGKSLLARYIHQVSDRRENTFEIFHAAHRPADLQADELFGHWKGAFTGADQDAPGIWERAEGGTVFIDEVADIDIKVQQTLMQPIEERKVRRMGIPPKGAPKIKDIDVLVILATNRDIVAAVSAGELKGDFLNRINAFTLDLPTLREHLEDLPLLIKKLSASVAPKWQGKFLPDALKALSAREWQEGNIRELRNVIELAITNNPDQDITEIDVKPVASGRGDFSWAGSDNLTGIQKMKLGEFLSEDIRKLTLADVDIMRRDLFGFLPEFLSQALIFALELTALNGKLNPTAAVRFLLGDDDLSTIQAKQFLKRLLTLDTKGKRVRAAFDRAKIYEQHEMLKRLMIDCQRPRRRSKSSHSPEKLNRSK